MQGDVFRAGFLADSAPGHQRIMLRPFRDHMEQVLQRPVELVGFRDARAMVQAVRRGNLEYAMAPGSVFAAAHRACACVEPLGAQPNRDGSHGLLGAVLTAKNGRVASMADLDRARLVIVGEGSVVAHHVMLAELWRADIELDDARIAFAASLPQANAMLNDGQADAILTWSRQAEGAVLFDAPPFNVLATEQRDGLSIVWRTRTLPSHTHFAHSDLTDATRDALRAMLLGLTGSNGDAFEAVDTGSGRAFLARELDDYAPYLDAYSYWDQGRGGR